MACAGHGRSVDISMAQMQRSQKSEERLRARDVSTSIKKFKKFLLTLNPAVAFNPARPVARSPRGNPILLPRRLAFSQVSEHCLGRRALVAGMSTSLADTAGSASAESEERKRQDRTFAGIKVSVGAALGNILQGFNTGVIAAALLSIVPEFELTKNPAVIGLIASAPTIGAVVGTGICSKFCDWFGRQKALVLSSLFYLAGGAVMWWSPDWWVLVCGRFVSGIAAGLVSAAVPTYIAECSEANLRGRLSTLPQLCISGGILLSYLVGLGAMLRGWEWRNMLAFSLVPATLQFFSVLTLPESPRWLLTKHKPAKAYRALRQLRGKSVDRQEILTEAMEMQEGLMRESPEEPKLKKRQNKALTWLKNKFKKNAKAKTTNTAVESASVLDDSYEEREDEKEEDATTDAGDGSEDDDRMGVRAILRDGSCRRALIICSLLQWFQQFCGVNAIVYFTPLILKQAGVHALFMRQGLSADVSAMVATVVAYVPKIPSVLLASALIDSRGRKWMLLRFIPFLIGSLWMLSIAVAGPVTKANAWLATAAVTIFGIFFGMSLGPLPNILSAEVFPTNARAAGVSATTTVQWLSNMAVAALFPIATQHFGMQKVLRGFAVFCVLAWLTVCFGVQETKGRTLEQINDDSANKQ